MARYVTGTDRLQCNLSPMCLDDYVSDDNSVRAIDIIVDSMNIPSLGFQYSETAVTGRKPYSPIDLFKLYTYSYFNGIRSSRKIERECGRNIEVMWLLNGLRPDYKTISEFRRINKTPIKNAFRRFSMLCDEMGLVSKEMVAVDGSKFKACNSRNKFHSKYNVTQMIQHYEDAAERYIELLEFGDREEGNAGDLLKIRQIKEKLERAQKKIASLEKLADKIDRSGPIYETDPDARFMKSNNNGGDIGYNVQIDVESENHLVVAVDTNNEGSDYRQFHKMARLAKEQLGVKELIVIADKGYYSGEEFLKCEEDNIIPIVAKPLRGKTSEDNFIRYRFSYDKDKDMYICPQGQKLYKAPSENNNQCRATDHYTNPEACKICPVKQRCTPNARGRRICRNIYSNITDKIDEQTKANQDIFRKRKCLVEHVFGNVKRGFGFTHFLTRRLDSVGVESCMHFLTYNIKRVINILGTTQIVGMLQR